MRRSALLLSFCWALPCGASPTVEFVAVGPQFASASAEYRQLWKEEGPRILAALEQAAGTPFPAGRIEAFVSAGPPMVSWDGRSMRLKADLSPDRRRAMLAHEFGHRLALGLRLPAGIDDHRLLYLFLYDAWTDLYGRDFAERMVRTEGEARNGYDYRAAWRWALAMSRAERRERLRAIVAASRLRPSLPLDFAGLFRGWDCAAAPEEPARPCAERTLR